MDHPRPGYQRAAAIRPEALAAGYDPYGFVAHAMGSVNGLLYSNTLEVLQLLADHPGVYLVPDHKYARPEIYRADVRQAAAMGRLDLLERVMPHVADQAELDALRAFYPLRTYILALSTPRPTSGWTTPRWSTSSAVTGSRQ